MYGFVIGREGEIPMDLVSRGRSVMADFALDSRGKLTVIYAISSIAIEGFFEMKFTVLGTAVPDIVAFLSLEKTSDFIERLVATGSFEKKTDE